MENLISGKIVHRNKTFYFESFTIPKKIFRLDLINTGNFILI